jgi:hypothetical protein
MTDAPADAPTVPLRPLIVGELVLAVLPARVIQAGQGGSVLIEVVAREDTRRPIRLWAGRPELETP